MAHRPKDEAIMGLYTWVPSSEGRNNDEAEPSKAVDIIAVQGLGANPYYTWVKKVTKAGDKVEEVMWLRDLLPIFVPNARIATFSYLSDWYTYKKGIKTTIRELGEQLLTALYHDRSRMKASRRPIVFIGHSMGGLVVKQALVLASNRSDCEDIRSSTTGAVFLGTPHEGTTIAQWASFLAIVKGNDSKLLEQLQPKAEMLYDLSHDFASGYQHLKTVCFYEKVGNTYVGGMLDLTIVDQRSAVQAGKAMVYLMTDHSGLNKFFGFNDPNFKLVRDAVVGMVQDSKREVPRSQNPHFMVSRRPNPLFTGRKDELDKLHNALSPLIPKDKPNFKADIYVLYGMGGAGKSEVAVNFVFESREKFWGIFWIDARSEASIAIGFKNIAHKLDLDESSNSVVSWLQDTSHSWLLILDNADEPTINLSPYLPAGVNGNIIITSRLPDCARKYSNAGKDCYERLNEETAIELFLKSCSFEWVLGSKHEDNARTIVDLLGCHALAIIQAGTAVSHGICKLEEYESMFSKQRCALLESMQDRINSEYGGVYTTFEITARYLEGRSDQVAKDALQLLNFHAFMHFSDFPEEAFVDAWKNSNDKKVVTNDQQTSGDKYIEMLDPWHRAKLPTFMRQHHDGNDLDIISLRNARNELESLSLINVDRSSFMTRLHPVTHAWSRDRLKGSKSEAAWLNALAVLSLSLGAGSTYRIVEQMLEPHVESMAKRPSYYDKYKAIFSIHQAFFLLARYLSHVLYDSAVAYEILQLIPIKADDARIGTLNFQLIQYLRARCAIDLGDLKEAEKLLKQASKPHGEVSKAEEEVQRAILLELARVHRRQDRHPEASKILEQLSQVVTEFSEAGPGFLTTLAHSYFEIGDLQKAKSIMEQVVPMVQANHSVDDPFRLNKERDLAIVYMELGDTTQALELLEHVTQTQARFLEPNDKRRLENEFWLAVCYYELGRYKESLRLAESIQGYVRNLRRSRLADWNTDLIRDCLEAIELEEASDRDVSLKEGQNEAAIEDDEWGDEEDEDDEYEDDEYEDEEDEDEEDEDEEDEDEV
ncbi:hypothetical protein BDR22DRAFT_891074 [Usnea florida]